MSSATIESTISVGDFFYVLRRVQGHALTRYDNLAQQIIGLG